MYDIFDDIFDDGYGYNDYGMSDTDVEVELAFEAAMGTGTDYEYDYATEGFGDAMSKVGNKIADVARNMVRKIGEMFRKMKQWITDRLAPLRAKSASGDNKALQQVLKSLDRQVTNASGPRKAEIKQRVARIKRAIMQSIDAMKQRVDTINRGLSDGVAVFKAAQSIGQSFIEKMNSATTSGSEKGNTDDGNDLIDKMNNLERRYSSITTAINTALDGDADDRIEEIISKEMPGGSTRLTEIMKAIKFDKIDFRAIFAAEAQLKATCTEGEDAAKKLELKLRDQYIGYVKNPNANGAGQKPYTRAYFGITEEDKKFDAESKQNLSALINNWQTFTQIENKLCTGLASVSSKFTKGSTHEMYTSGVRKTGRSVPDSELPTTHYEEPTDQTIH